MSIKEQQRQEREQRIMTVVSEIIREAGYDGLNMDLVAERVGVSKPTLYQHFRGKEDMVVQTIIRSMEQMVEYILTVESGSPLARVERIMTYMLESQFDGNTFPVDMMLDQFVTLLYTHPDMIRYTERVNTLLRSLLREAQLQGEVADDLKLDSILRMMYSLQSSVGIRAQEYQKPTYLQQIAADVVKIFIRGISRPPA